MEEVTLLEVVDEAANCKLTAKKLIGISCAGSVKAYRGTYEKQEEEIIPVCFKVTAVDQESETYKVLQQQCSDMGRVLENHANILGIHKKFTEDGKLYVIFRCMAVGSIRSVIMSHYSQNNGLPESQIVAILKETLKGLAEIHRSGQVHKELSAAHIYLGEPTEVRLAFSATLHAYSNKMRNPSPISLSVSSSSSPSLNMPLATIAEWCCAPEVYGENTYTPKADIWLFGVTALEIAYSGFNVRELITLIDKINRKKQLPWKKKQVGNSTLTKLEDLWLKLKKKKKKREFSKAFELMVIRCLANDPDRRPSAEELLGSEVFASMASKVALQHLYESLQIGLVQVEENYI